MKEETYKKIESELMNRFGYTENDKEEGIAINTKYQLRIFSFMDWLKSLSSPVPDKPSDENGITDEIIEEAMNKASKESMTQMNSHPDSIRWNGVQYLKSQQSEQPDIEGKPYNVINEIHLPLNPEHRLVRWANYMRGYYGYPIYLVGSALNKTKPRDIDVCCIIPDELFCKRYHIDDISQHVSKKISGIWTDEHWRWSDDIIKKVYHGWDFTHMNIDFKVISETENKEQRYSDKPKLQLDTKTEQPEQKEVTELTEDIKNEILQIGTKYGIMNGFTVHSNPTLAEGSFINAMDEYAAIVEKRGCTKCAMSWTKNRKALVLPSKEEIEKRALEYEKSIGTVRYKKEALFDYTQGYNWAIHRISELNSK